MKNKQQEKIEDKMAHEFPQEHMVVDDYWDEGVRVLICVVRDHFCVYFGIPEDHPLAGFHYDKLPIECHYGLTFGSSGDGKLYPEGYFWYGYDYAHAGDWLVNSIVSSDDDTKWTLGDVKEDMWYALRDFKNLKELAEEISKKENTMKENKQQEKRKIYRRVYDNPKYPNGNDKPNQLLGEFEVVRQIEEGSYNEKFIGKKEGKKYLVSGREVSGYYHPYMGGMKYEVTCLEEIEK